MTFYNLERRGPEWGEKSWIIASSLFGHWMSRDDLVTSRLMSQDFKTLTRVCLP